MTTHTDVTQGQAIQLWTFSGGSKQPFTVNHMAPPAGLLRKGWPPPSDRILD